jgi:predicted anti-sigma-YlaC factor YlaD
MQCKAVQKQFDRFVRGELAPQEQSTIKTHLEQCEACRQCLVREERLTMVLKTVPEPPALPDGFEGRVVEAARQRQTEYIVVGQVSSSKRSRPSQNGRGWRALVPSGIQTVQATVLTVGVLLGILMGQQTWQSVHPSSSAAANQNDPQAAYHLDCLNDAPDGSLAESFLTLTASPNPSER